MILVCPTVYLPIQDIPNIPHQTPNVDQGHYINMSSYAQNVPITSPTEIITDSQSGGGAPHLFTANMLN